MSDYLPDGCTDEQCSSTPDYATYPSEDDYDYEYCDESYCWDCGGRGWKITCIDDLCHGYDECIHGDAPTKCWTCNRDGEKEDNYL